MAFISVLNVYNFLGILNHSKIIKRLTRNFTSNGKLYIQYVYTRFIRFIGCKCIKSIFCIQNGTYVPMIYSRNE